MSDTEKIANFINGVTPFTGHGRPNAGERSDWLRFEARRAVASGLSFGDAALAVSDGCGCDITAARRHVGIVLGILPDKSAGRGGRRVKYTDDKRRGLPIGETGSTGSYAVVSKTPTYLIVNFDGADGVNVRIYSKACIVEGA